MAATKGVHHIGLTVPNLEATRRFFIDTLGYDEVGGQRDYPAVFLSDGTTMITLWQARDPERAVPFDRKNVVGLHHLALAILPELSLTEMHARLQQAAGVEVEFGPEPLGGGPTQHLMCSIPGGIRVELIAPSR